MPIRNLIQSLTGISLIQIDDFIFSEERINNISAYETVHSRLITVLSNKSEQWVKSKVISNFVERHGFNAVKLGEHFKEAAFYHIYRPVEISIIASKRSIAEKKCFVFKKSPFSDLILEEFRNETIMFYKAIFSQYFKIVSRDNYYFDKIIKNVYFSCRIITYILVIRKWISIFILALLYKMFLKQKEQLMISNNNKTNIGIEFLQHRLRLYEINDFFWIEDSQIDKNNLYSIETKEIDDESEQAMSKLGIMRIRIITSHRLLIKKIFASLSKDYNSNIFFVTPELSHMIKAVLSIFILVGKIFTWNENNWLYYQLVIYKYKVLYWQSIFSQTNIKILSSMIDVDDDKLPKAQAIECLGGFYTGTHWSNFPMIRVDNQKCYDILFTWGEHFFKHIFNTYPYLATFIVGYPTDYYFKKQLKQAHLLRSKFPNRFILSYHDNIMANDISYSTNMQIKIHEMLIDIIKKNDNVVLFLKPKRTYVFDEIAKKIPDINSLIERERIVTFFGDTPRTKAVPAMVGMASDLVVGLGISTAAAECYFAGTLAFHADLTGFVNNEFGNIGLNKVVFRDIKNLREAIQDCVDNGTKEKYERCKDIYSMLDPFQDGHAYKRVGFVIKNLQTMLSKGLSRGETIRVAKDRYKELIDNTYQNENFK